MVQVVCVQNMYNIVNRGDDALVDLLAQQGIAYVPFFPLGGFTPLQSSGLKAVADSLGVTAMQVALAWLLQRSPNILLIRAPLPWRICGKTSRRGNCSCRLTRWKH
jgi:aryl-alcohol dehydrogenase-like predicted oxidoreductase